MTGNAKRKLRNEINGFVFAMPVILGVLIFTFYPAVQSLFYAFTNFDGAYKMDWVGFNNFRLMFRDTETALVFKNTFLYALISVPVNLLLGYFLALIANFIRTTPTATTSTRFPSRTTSSTCTSAFPAWTTSPPIRRTIRPG